MDSEETNQDLHLGYEQFVSEFRTLVSSYPPPFIYVNDAQTRRATSFVIQDILKDDFNDTLSPGAPKVFYAMVDAVATFTSRILYDSVLNSLAHWEVSWEEGCSSWNVEGGGQRWHENLDGFLHGLRTLAAHLSKQQPGAVGEEWGDGVYGNVRFVIVVERAERLKESLPELIVPLSRLAELSRLDLSVIFISEAPWEDIRPAYGASPDPFFMDIPPPTKEDIAKQLAAKYPMTSDSPQNHPSLKPLYSNFISVLCDVCFPFTHDPEELAYIAAARWPGFVRPILDSHAYNQHDTVPDENGDVDMDSDAESSGLQPLTLPTEGIRIRLIRLFTPSLSVALEALLPRLTNATDWAKANEPPPNLLAQPPGGKPLEAVLSPYNLEGAAGMAALPRMNRFILIAAFLASMNPNKSDLRMFGRGLDEKKRKRRARTTAGKGPSKVPQRLLGPTPFAIDRLLAILGALLEENDVDARIASSDFVIPGEYTDMEIGRVGVCASIMELTSMRLLHRTSPSDRLDGPPMFKCAISYDATLGLARQLDVPLNDLLWDTV